MTIDEIISIGILELKDELFFVLNDFNTNLPLHVKTDKIYYNMGGLPMFQKLPVKFGDIRVENSFRTKKSTDLHTYFEIEKLKKRKNCQGWYDGFRTEIYLNPIEANQGFHSLTAERGFSFLNFLEVIDRCVKQANRLSEHELDMTTKIVRFYSGGINRNILIFLSLNTTQPHLF